MLDVEFRYSREEEVLRFPLALYKAPYVVKRPTKHGDARILIKSTLVTALRH